MSGKAQSFESHAKAGAAASSRVSGPLTLLHGFAGSSASWGQETLERLSARVEVRALDLPGHGRQVGGDRESRFTLASTLDGISADRAGEGPLLGYSMGGRIALHYALREPTRVTRLVLESASPGIADPEERQARREADEELAAWIEAEGISAFVERWEALPLFASERALPEGVRARARAVRLSNDAAGLAASLRGLGTGALPSLWDSLSTLHVPTLVLVGGLDSKFCEIGERMAALLPNAQLVVVEEAGHRVHLERPEAWAEAVLGFLERPLEDLDEGRYTSSPS